jgi:hypothetical protein
MLGSAEIGGSKPSMHLAADHVRHGALLVGHMQHLDADAASWSSSKPRCEVLPEP